MFLVKESVLYTPPIETPVLAGVARKTICQIAVKESVTLVEKDLYISDLLDADEIFLSNVIMQVMPVVRVEKHITGAGRPGPVTEQMRRCFKKTVEAECPKKR